MGRDTVVRQATEDVLFQEEWKTERVINRFRTVVWAGGGIIALVTDIVEHEHIEDLTPFVTLATAAVVVLIDLLWLRRRFHRIAPVLLSILDITAFTFLMHSVHEESRNAPPVEAFHPTTMTAIGIMFVIAVNALRFSRLAAVVSVVYGSAAYLWVLYEHKHFHTMSVMDIFFFAMTGAMVIYSSRKLRAIIHRVKERDAFARFLPGPAVERLTRNPLAMNLAGEEQDATVLFADIRDFTALSENLDPARVVAMLNEYFEEMVDEIFRWDGVLDKFIGDGICAVFSGAVAAENPARRALNCGLGMLRRLDRLNALRVHRGEPPLKIGIGIHTGRLVAGSIGSALRMEYTHVGDTVNTASRVEGLCKEMREALLASAAAYDRAGGAASFVARAMEPVHVKGKPQPIQVFAVDGLKDER